MNPPVPIRSKVRRTRLAVKVNGVIGVPFYSSRASESRGHLRTVPSQKSIVRAGGGIVQSGYGVVE